MAYFRRGDGGDSFEHILCADSYCGVAFVGDRGRAVSHLVDSGGLESLDLSLLSAAVRTNRGVDVARSDDSLVYIGWEC